MGFGCLGAQLILPAALAYRLLPFDHDTTKRVHVALHSVAGILILLGLCAVWTFHNVHHFRNLSSLHSWCGLSLFTLWLFNYVCALWHFYFPSPGTEAERRQLVPVHTAAGKFIAGLGLVVMLLGIAEKLLFNQSCNLTGWLEDHPVVDYMSFDCYMGNFTAIMLIGTMMFLSFALLPYQQPTVEDEEEQYPLLRT